MGSGVAACRLSCSATCGIILDQGSNPCLLHSQVDSLPLSHQGSPQNNVWQLVRQMKERKKEKKKEPAMSWWWTGRPGVLWFMGSQGVGHDWATELSLNHLTGEVSNIEILHFWVFFCSIAFFCHAGQQRVQTEEEPLSVMTFRKVQTSEKGS